MKLLFIKDWENFPGHVIPAGSHAEVDNAIAKKLIFNKTAKEINKRPLPEDLPGYELLIAAGIHTFQQLDSVKDLTSIKGIGRATKAKIKNYLEKLKY